ncbi:MAG: UDP-N-acetylmuramoyl-L-alanyl-D-glutamate--2,6-diaminopimelate ligase, partial [Candidatus Omnitrophica bacterium]|nr:UDP-N-acetylmuramoyl-L-alanyl-D-glutamate--2,6-diaminopimelate ligase [Candidatus Omnitrophota bacterium]
TNTTPESIDLQALLAEMLEGGLTHAVMEVSSHALQQGRIESVDFDAAVFTNIARHEHLDYHKNFRNYLEAKLKFFSDYLPASSKKEKYAIINLDDAYSQIFIKTAKKAGLNIATFGLSKKAQYHPENFYFDRSGMRFTLNGKDFVSPLMGMGNLYNCLAAIATANCFSIELEIISSAIANIGSIPGRMEFVSSGQPFTVVVDYAHTHQALQDLLRTVRHLNPERILLVFGCGGDRDRSKRPLMGKIAAKLADIVYITSDNPRNEDPEKIIEDIYSGIVFWRRKKCRIIPDRRQAITKALADARKGDWVVIAGKGHEQYQIIKNVFHSFDDRKVAQEFLKKQNQKY